jgi:hypothetical protein
MDNNIFSLKNSVWIAEIMRLDDNCEKHQGYK